MEGFMKKLFAIILVSLTLICPAFAKDRSNEYQEGTVSMSTLSGHEVYTFKYSDGRVGDVASREKFSADSLKLMKLVDGGPPVKVMYRIGHKLGVGDFVAIPAPDDSKKEGIYFLMGAHRSHARSSEASGRCCPCSAVYDERPRVVCS
jgi:hypothetical protein